MKRNRDGFNTIELLCILVVLSIVIGLITLGIVELRREQSSIKSAQSNIVQQVTAKPQVNPDSIAAAAEQGGKGRSSENATASTPTFLYVISPGENRVTVYLYVQNDKGRHRQGLVASGSQIALVTDRPLTVKDNILTINTTPQLEAEK